jgi:hypothetical protein
MVPLFRRTAKPMTQKMLQHRMVTSEAVHGILFATVLNFHEEKKGGGNEVVWFLKKHKTKGGENNEAV